MRWLCAAVVLLAFALNGCSCGLRGTPGGDDDGAEDAGLPDGARDAYRPDGPKPGDGPRPEGGPHSDGGPWPDGGPHPDGGPGPDGGACGYSEVWHLEPRAIQRVSLVNGATPRYRVTEQLLVEVQLLSGSCEDLAAVELVNVQTDANDYVQLVAYVWRAQGTVGCTADAPVATHVVTIPGRDQVNGSVLVVDASQGGWDVRLSYARQPCSGVPDCQCSFNSPPGSVTEHGACVTDCSCAVGLACIGYWGFAGPLWTCERPCADSRDCERGTFCATQVADGPNYVCLLGSQCGSGAECPVGFTCEADASGWTYCKDLRAGPTWQPCQCDADCSLGNRCTWDEDLADCLTPCRKDSDCPSTGGLGYGTCTDSVCVYYWE